MYAEMDRWRAAQRVIKEELPSLRIKLNEETVGRKRTVEALEAEVARLKVEVGQLRGKMAGLVDTVRRTEEGVLRVEGLLRGEAEI